MNETAGCVCELGWVCLPLLVWFVSAACNKAHRVYGVNARRLKDIRPVGGSDEETESSDKGEAKGDAGRARRKYGD